MRSLLCTLLAVFLAVAPVASAQPRGVPLERDHLNAQDESQRGWTAIAISIVSLLASIGVVVYTYRRDKRARRQAITDDYWLRQIVGPHAIEPLISLVMTSLATLPDVGEFDRAKIREVGRKFAKDYQHRHREAGARLMLLALLDLDLYKRVSRAADAIEDQVLNYCWDIERHSAVGEFAKAAAQKAPAQQGMMSALNGCLKCVEGYQHKIG